MIGEQTDSRQTQIVFTTVRSCAQIFGKIHWNDVTLCQKCDTLLDFAWEFRLQLDFHINFLSKDQSLHVTTRASVRGFFETRKRNKDRKSLAQPLCACACGMGSTRHSCKMSAHALQICDSSVNRFQRGTNRRPFLRLLHWGNNFFLQDVYLQRRRWQEVQER